MSNLALRETIKILIKEELSKTVAKFKIDSVVDDCTDEIRQLVLRDINVSARSSSERRKMTVALESVLEEFKSDLETLVRDKLLAYTGFI